MEHASTIFRPTWRQALGRGLYLGAWASPACLVLVAFVTVLLPLPEWVWVAALAGPPPAGAVLWAPVGRMARTRIGAGGISTRSTTASRETAWAEVVDLRAERRGGRTVVSVYLSSGGSLRLEAPYSGLLFAEDPRFEGKMISLSYLWRTNRFGGLPGC